MLVPKISTITMTAKASPSSGRAAAISQAGSMRDTAHMMAIPMGI